VHKNPYNNCCQMSFFLSQNTPKSMSAVASSQTPLGSLQRSPRHPSWFQGGRFAVGGEWRGGLGEGKGDELGREGKRGSWGNSALVVGGQTPLRKGRVEEGNGKGRRGGRWREGKGRVRTVSV